MKECKVWWRTETFAKKKTTFWDRSKIYIFQSWLCRNSKGGEKDITRKLNLRKRKSYYLTP